MVSLQLQKQGCPWRPQTLLVAFPLSICTRAAEEPLSKGPAIQAFSISVTFMPTLTFSVRVGGETPAGKYQIISTIGWVGGGSQCRALIK